MHSGFGGVYRGIVNKLSIGGIFPQFYGTFGAIFEGGYFRGFHNP
jgi:hypothetical protein